MQKSAEMQDFLSTEDTLTSLPLLPQMLAVPPITEAITVIICSVQVLFTGI